MKIKASSLTKRNIQKFMSNRMAVLGAVILIIMILSCVFAPLITKYAPERIDTKNKLSGITARHILGTDRLGRDIFSRLLYGGRISIFIGLASAVGASAIGVVTGCIAGYYGGATDKILVAVSEFFSIFPQTLLILLCMGFMGQSLVNIILIFIVTGWSGVFRIVRSRILSLKQEPFVESCIVNGISGVSIMFRQLLPNTIGPVVVHTTLATAGYILAEAGLSFLGLGVPSKIPTWGNIINAAKRLDIIINSLLLWIAPGRAISLFVLSVNFLGDGLRDVFDTKS